MTDTPTAASTDAWTAVIPVKVWARAKTRLDLPDEARIDFARAVASDTIETVAASAMIGRVVVVTAEAQVADIAADAPSAVVLREPSQDAPDSLNLAIGLAREWAATHAPASPMVVVPADLAALSTAHLEGALRRLAWFERGHVPDHRGTGTTLCAAARPDLLAPRYGPDSERAHAAAGSVPILDVAYEVRLDVDNLDDLTGAASMGLARRTQRACPAARSAVS
jgi:2-phospho-L-lactate guanylyltransferase